MAWRKVIVPVLVICLVLAMPAQAYAAEVYDGTISTTYITIFRDIASKIPINADYVFFRSGQNEYMMAVGDFAESGNSIEATGEVTIYAISTNNNNYSNGYEYSVSTQSGYSLDPGSALIYSNLGHYPDLIERIDYFGFATLLLLFVGLCLYLLRSLLGFCLRRR